MFAIKRSIRIAAFLIVVLVGVLAPSQARAQWGGWEPLGGRLQDNPGCLATNETPVRIHCFQRGTDNAMWHAWWTGAAWRWESLGGAILDRPECLTTTEVPIRLHCFARGTDSALWQRSYAAGWGEWRRLGGQLRNAPSCVATDETPVRLHCFLRGTDNAMWHTWWLGGPWNWESLGGGINDQPDCLTTNEDPVRLHCFARGTDNALWHKWYDSGWSGWERLGGQLRNVPSCFSTDETPVRVHCFMRGTDNGMWHVWWSSRWRWEGLGGSLQEAPDCVMTSDSPTRIHCFARGVGNAMWRTWWTGERWRSWETAGGVLTSQPTCVATSEVPSRLHCFVRGADTALWHRWWIGEPESLANFGFDTPAEGCRPDLATCGNFARSSPRRTVLNVVLALVNYADTAFDATQTPEFYVNQYFGAGSSLQDYFNENSHEVDFQINHVATIRLRHPQTLACAHRWPDCVGNDGKPMETAFVEFLQGAQSDQVEVFKNFDRNGDHVLTPDEIIVLFVEALPEELDWCGLARYYPTSVTLPTSGGYTIVGGSAFYKLADRTNFITGAHEMAHSFGARDLYAYPENVNDRYGLMGATCTLTDSRYHLDPWHKIRMGLAQPQIIAIPQSMNDTVQQYLSLPRDATYHPILFYDPARGKNEYFLFEYRNPAAGGFDFSVPGAGLIVWAVKTDSSFVPVDLTSINPRFPSAGAVAVIAPPGQTIPAGSASGWDALDGEVALRWLDGTDSRLRFQVQSDPGTSPTLQFVWRVQSGS